MSTDPASQELILVDDSFDDSESQKFFRLATAYAKSSHFLFESIISGKLPATFEQAKTAHLLFDHAAELFFKGAELKKNGSFDKHHKLEDLYKAYQTSYPETEFKLSGKIDETVRHDPQTPNS